MKIECNAAIEMEEESPMYVNGEIVLGDYDYRVIETINDLANDTDRRTITRKHAPKYYKMLVSTVCQCVKSFFLNFVACFLILISHS